MMNHLPTITFLLIVFAVSVPLPRADEHDHRYKAGDKVDLWVSKTGPYANPQEAYEYYSLPYCTPDTGHHPPNENSSSNINQLFYSPIHARHSGVDLIYPASPTGESGQLESCTTEPLTVEQVKSFAKAVEDQWFYQWSIDGLPFWGMVGEMLPDLARDSYDRFAELETSFAANHTKNGGGLKPYVYTNRNLRISYNKDRIIKVDLISEPSSLEKVKAGVKLKFDLEIYWITTPVPFDKRFDRYLDHAFFQMHSTFQRTIHWVGLLILSITGLILRLVLKKDYARYALVRSQREDTEDEEEAKDEEGIELASNNISQSSSSTPLIQPAGDDHGWKLVHGDVFRAPSNLPLLAALIGSGWQLVMLILTASLVLNQEKSAITPLTPLGLVCILLSFLVSGFKAGRHFKLYSTQSSEGGDTDNDQNQLKVVMAYTTLLLPTMFGGVFSVINCIAFTHGTVYYIPFSTTIKPVLLWLSIGAPMCILGVFMGYQARFPGGERDPFPCRVNVTPRPIPTEIRWYCKPVVLVPIVGLLSFGSILMELYYIMTTLWNYKFLEGGGFHVVVLALLCLVASMATVIVVYICLNKENHLWQWIAFYSGGSTALFVFLYSIYYYWAKTSMHGLVQNSVYFGFMLLISIGLGIICGTMSHQFANQFVWIIFKNLKID